MPDQKVTYSDIIQPDDSIERLIRELEAVNKTYSSMADAISRGAKSIENSLKSASGATSSGRKEIDEAAIATSRLERAQRELRIALTDTGHQIAWLKAQTSDANRASVQQERYIRQAASSYDRLKSDLRESVQLYRSLTDAERADSQMGQQLIQNILDLKNRIKELDEQIKPHINHLTEVQKAEERLAYLQSEEGQRLLELKRQISELTSLRRQNSASADSMAEAQRKLAYAQSEENAQLRLYSTQIRQANRIADLQNRYANSAIGSYNRLSAEYELNKIRLNEMSAEMRKNSEAGRVLVKRTQDLYEEMRRLQEETGSYRLSVGHYQNMWDGLGVSVSQIVRELPSAAISMNTFFLAISNNIPMLIDEIKTLRRENEMLAAQGKETRSVIGSIGRALFSWNTVLVVIMTVLSMFADEIMGWVSSLFEGRKEVVSLSEAMGSITEELSKSAGEYGRNITLLKQLQNEYKNLRTEAEKTEWIEANTEAFRQLGLAVSSVSEADRVLISNTGDVIRSMQLRAKAAAAQNLAAEQYEKALAERTKAEDVRERINREGPGGHSFLDHLRLDLIARFSTNPAHYGGMNVEDVSYPARLDILRIQALTALEKQEKAANDNAAAMEESGDRYTELYIRYLDEAEQMLRRAGIREYASESSSVSRSRSSSGEEPRDLTRTINRNDINIRRQYEESVTNLIQDEYAKRRKAADDQVQNENARLRELYRQNEEYVANVKGKYKELTDEQRKQIEEQQRLITETVANNLKYLDLQVRQIMNEQNANSIRVSREELSSIGISSDMKTPDSVRNQSLITPGVEVSPNADAIERSIVEERKLMEENLTLEYQMILDTNRRLLEAQDENARSEEEIITEYNKRKIQLYADYDKQILEQRQHNIEAQLEVVQKGSQDELDLLVQQNEVRRQMELSENAALPASQQVSTSSINARYDRSERLTRGQFDLNAFEQQQEIERNRFNLVEHTEQEITRFQLEQEADMWARKIALAKAGGLDWSQAQIDAAELALQGVNDKLKDLGPKANDLLDSISKNGLTGSILEAMGFDDDAIRAFNDATQTIIENLQSIAEAETELAQQAVEAAEERVSAAEEAYQAEIEARNNGYANNVATAKKELQEERKKQLERQRILQEAQRREQMLDTLTQTSSLITASANIWKSMSSMGIVGPILAAAAIAGMWTSFAASKIKARQVTAASDSEAYGEGGLEFLEGGSHASGHDIDLGVRNRRRKRMRAEGGEAMAIVNRRSTRKYRRMLPSIVDSLNKGTFEAKYLNAFSAGSDAPKLLVEQRQNVDLSGLEHDVRDIRKQGETKYYTTGNGYTVIKHKNVTRIIKR